MTLEAVLPKGYAINDIIDDLLLGGHDEDSIVSRVIDIRLKGLGRLTTARERLEPGIKEKVQDRLFELAKEHRIRAAAARLVD